MKFADDLADLDLRTFVATWPAPLGELTSSPILDEVGTVPVGLEAAVRDLLRRGGFRPSGRNKPASEYLARAAALPRINLAVDAGNAISRASGLPVSVVDVDRLVGEARVAIAPPGTSYVFNPSGQVFDATGLCCVFDDDGVCATPVKDAQRTKTSPTTTRTLCVIWGVRAYQAHVASVLARYRALVLALGASAEP